MRAGALHRHHNRVISFLVKSIMPTLEEQFDDAMFDFSQGGYESAIDKYRALLSVAPSHFDAQLALGMALYRQGKYVEAIAEGHKAERLKPHEQLVHTNLSLFYMKTGDKKTAEHHGLQARIASWKENMEPPAPGAPVPDLQMAKPNAPSVSSREQPPDMPWKKKPATQSISQTPPVEPAPKKP